MSLARLFLLAGATSAAAFLIPSSFSDLGQQLLGARPKAADFTCNVPPVLKPDDDMPSADELFSSPEALAKQIERHQTIVRIPSICYDDLGEIGEDERWAPFYDLHDALAETYPKIHERAKLTKVNTFGLVFELEGSDASLKPALLAAHEDVVPVADESTWTHPPFDAVWDGTYLWGRGSSDDKNSMTALMSAVETILGDEDWTPRRTLIMAFGFDEECSGYRGAGHITTYLTEKYGDNGLAIVLDEGGLGLQKIDDVLYALPAVMEKGHIDVWLELDVVGGHSSVPFPHTGIGIMSEIVTTLEANPYERQLTKDSPVYGYMECLAQYSPDAVPGLGDLLEADDLDGLGGLLVQMEPRGTFLIQTSQAVDMISGGQKINAMPEVTMLGVNYRVAPQDSLPKVQHNVVKYVQDVVAKYNLSVEAFKGDKDYEDYVAEIGSEDPVHSAADVDYQGTLILTSKQKTQVSPQSPTSGSVWDVFSGTIQYSFASKAGTIVPTGSIMTGNTDTRHYLNLTPNVYRWSPSQANTSWNAHTIDERVRMDAHMDMVKFYYNFVRNFDQAEL